MEWKRIEKEKSKQPIRGTYKDTHWKEQIAKECNNQCIYCCIKDGRFGGLRNFHIEHYKPKSKRCFKHLINNIKNLYLSCPICNSFKKDDWPNNPNKNLDIPCYPDPSKINYGDIINLDIVNFSISGKKIATRYMIERIYLNRPQLILERRRWYKLRERRDLFTNVRHNIEKLKNSKRKYTLADKLLKMADRYNKLSIRLEEISPYKLSDIKR